MKDIIHIETKRLIIDTMSLSLIDAAAKRDYDSISALGYLAGGEWPSDDFIEAIPVFREMIVTHGDGYGFGSWIVADRESKEIIGGIGFIGGPDDSGTVEIGFGINPDRRQRGYCAESVEAMVRWAFTQTGVRRVKAHCEKDNAGSIAVLAKTGFVSGGEENGLLLRVREKR